MEDLGIEAKEAAVREVAKLLPLPELLASIASIKSDYLARQQVWKSNSSKFNYILIRKREMLSRIFFKKLSHTKGFPHVSPRRHL